MDARAAYAAIQDLRSDDKDHRINAINDIPAIASILGSERTANELIPFLVETSVFSECEWVIVLKKISEISFVKTSIKSYDAFLRMLASVGAYESVQIRNSCLSVMTTIMREIPDDTCGKIINRVLGFMAQSVPSVRAIAVLLFANVIDKLSVADKTSLNVMFIKYKNDDVIAVRRALVISGRSIIKFLRGSLEASVVGAVKVLAKDKSAAVSYQVPGFLVELMKKDDMLKDVMSIGEQLLEHESWRVRCEYICNLRDIYGTNVDSNVISEILVRSTEDSADEVKTAVAEGLSYLSSFDDIPKEDAHNIIVQLMDSESWYVRVATVKAVPGFVKHLPSEFIMTTLLEATENESHNVKLVSIEALGAVDLPVETVILHLTQNADSQEWRERERITMIISKLMKTASSENAPALVEKLLFDESRDVRKAMIAKLKGVVACANDDVLDKIAELIEKRVQSADYQERQTAIEAIFSASLEDRSSCKSLLQQLASDPVSNVKLVLAKTLPRTEDFASILDKLKKDSDCDVREAASE